MNKLSREAINVAADRCEEQGATLIAGGLRMLAREPGDGDSFLSVQSAIEEIMRGVIVNYRIEITNEGGINDRRVHFEVWPRPNPSAILCTYCGRIMSLACGCPGSRAAAEEEEAEQEAEVREHAATCAGIGHGSDPCDCGYQETKK